MNNFDGRTAVITGGASGIGLGLAERLAAEAMKLVLADIEAPVLDEAASRLRDSGADVTTFVCDVSDGSSVDALADFAFQTHGTVHVVCNNAGVVAKHESWGPLSDWEWVLGVDLWGVIHGVRAFVPRMLAAGEEGHIMNTASTAGLLAFPGIPSYNVAKRGVVALSETLYHEFENTALGVSVLCPGIVATNITKSERNRPGPDARPYESIVPHAGAAESMTPAQVADCVLDAMRSGRFWILPQEHYGAQALDQAQRRIDGGPPVMPYIDR